MHRMSLPPILFLLSLGIAVEGQGRWVYPQIDDNEIKYHSEEEHSTAFVHKDDEIIFPHDKPEHGPFRPPSFHTNGLGNPINTALPSKKRKTSKPGRSGDQRLCERKYTEYITRIFPNEEDTVQDANDSQFDGRVLATPGEYPHMSAIGFVGSTNGSVEYKCGGSLISEKFVITVAHCTNLRGQIPTVVRIGDLNLLEEEANLEPQLREIGRIYNHQKYKLDSYYNDIALLELDREVEFTEFVRPIRLWVNSELPYNTAYAMGYGSTSFSKAPTNRLTDLTLTIVPNDQCNKTMPSMPEAVLGIIDSQICAQDFEKNRDTCQGDSGGPLQFNLLGRRRRNRKHFHLIGITSFGLICRSSNPGVYTRVYSFLDWIESIVWE